jgi:hypothetical protein
VLSPDKLSLKFFTLTPGYCRAYFGRLSTSPLFDEKKRGSVKQNISPKHNKFSFLNSPLFLFKERGRG